MTRPVALTIAGSDSSGGAGLQADLKTFETLGVWGTCAVTAITAQNSLGVHQAHAVPADMVAAQIDAIVADTPPGAVKTGMLATAELIEVVVAAIGQHHLFPLVVDPVMAATAGGRLLDLDAVSVLKQTLLPHCTIFTPNIPEAEALLDQSIPDLDSMEEAARALAALGTGTVLLKGGHLGGDRSPDLLWSEGRGRWLDGPRIDTVNTHGTGCVLSAAITARLAAGDDLAEACIRAKDLVAGAVRAALPRPAGVGPVDPGWPHRDIS